VETTHQLGQGTGGPHGRTLGIDGFKQGENLKLLGIAKSLWLAHHHLPFWGIWLAGMIDQPPGWGKSCACDRCPQAGRSRIGYQVGTMGNDLEDAAVEVLIMSSVQSVRPPSVRVSGRAQAELRAGETLVFDWTSLAFCCAVAGEISLRPTTLQEAQRPSAYVPIRSDDGPLLFAHRMAHAMLVGRTIEVDCRRRLGVRSFSSSLPSDLGLRTSFGRETGT